MEKIIRIKNIVVKVGAVIAGFSVTAMMILTCCDVFARNFLHSTVSGAYETTQYILMPLAVFFALPAAYDAGIMPRVGDLIEKAPKRLQAFVRWTVCAVELIIYSILTFCAFRFAINGFRNHNGVTMGGKIVSTYPIYIVLPIGFMMVLILIIMTYFLPKSKRDEAEKKERLEKDRGEL